MPLTDSTTLTRFFNQGEIELSQEQPFLVKRFAIATSTSTAVYTVPDDCLSIRRITYLGMKLDPLNQRNQRDVFQRANQKGRPFWYIFNNIGLKQIQFFPAPAEVIADPGSGYWDIHISDSVIVEYYCATDNSTYTVQPFLRNQLLKKYLAKMVASVDGPSFSSKLLKYFSTRWEEDKADYFKFNRSLYSDPRKLIISEIVSNNYFPGSPVLPIATFGESVDEGY